MVDSKKFERSKVVQIVQSVISKMEGLSENSLSSFREELLALRDEINAVQNDMSNESSGATVQARDELDAVVVATKEATDVIMNACEGLEAFALTQDASVQAQIQQHVTLIYEACSFQDITGQRIARVIKLLQLVQGKVGAMLDSLDRDEGRALEGAVKPNDEALMNGPQLPANALSQEDIDSLLASFD